MFTDLNQSLAELKNLPAMRGRTTADDDQFLTRLLELSAGKNALNQTIYRIYYTAAKWLEEPGSIHVVSEASGAKFTGLAVPIASLYALQAATDTALSLTVPPGFEIPVPESSGTTARPIYPFGSMTVPVEVQP